MGSREADRRRTPKPKGRRGKPPQSPRGAPGGVPAPRSRRRIIAATIGAALILIVVGYLLWSARAGPFRGDTSAYNVLLITLDTTRADRLGCYGHRAARTPNLDALAAAGVLFENAYTPTVITLPSHATILTGLLPPVHGVRNNGGERLPPEAETLAEILKETGFRTGAVIGAFLLKAMFGLDQGFDSYDDYLPGSGTDKPSFPERTAAQVTDAALRWLSGARSERWFLWAHYFDPHSPFNSPPPYRRWYADRPYDGEIAYMDAEIGRLLEGVSRSGARDRTIVIAVGDHGEGLRDHGEFSHGVFLYDETARVPLIVTVPGFTREPRRVRAVVRTTDILPTILDLLRLPPRREPFGTSLWPLMDGRVADLGLAAYSEATTPYVMYGWSPIASLREGRWKYIQAPRPELYDVAADPAERADLLAAEGERAAGMRRKLERILESVVGTKLGAEEVSTTPEDQAKLRSLGYVGDGAPAGEDLLTGDPKAILDGGARGLADPKDRLVQLERITQVYIAFSAGDFASAAERARRILEEEPDATNVRQYLADSLRSMGRLEEALSEYRILQARDPERLEALLNIGWVLMTLKRFEESRETFERALRIQPGHTYALASMGTIHLMQGELDEAAEFYNQILAQRPNDRQSIMTLARIYEKRGMVREAMDLFRRAADLDPKEIEARLSLGWLQFRSKEYESAIATIGEAAAAHPGMPDPDLFRGDIYLEMGRLAEAGAFYTQAISKAPGEPLGYHGLGRVAAAQGNADLARRYFERALRADPAFEPAREELQRLK